MPILKKNEQKWLENYALLKEYIEEHRHLPNKKKVENRGLLNWWKYNRKLVRTGRLDEERAQMLARLSELRSDSLSAPKNKPHDADCQAACGELF